MALIDDIKAALRVSTDAMDAEVATLCSAALSDMLRVGVDPAMLSADGGETLVDPLTDDVEDPFVRQGVASYAKAHFGYDNPEASRFDDSYRRIVCDLMNSSANIAAKDDGDE